MMTESILQSGCLQEERCPQLAEVIPDAEEGTEEDGTGRESVTRGGKGTNLWGRVQNVLLRRKVNRDK